MVEILSSYIEMMESMSMLQTHHYQEKVVQETGNFRDLANYWEGYLAAVRRFSSLLSKLKSNLERDD